MVYSPYHGGYTQYQRRAERTISRIEREIPEAGRCLLRYGELNLAAEYMMDNLFAERLEADDLLPIYEGGYRYLLVETTGFTPPMTCCPS